MNKVMNDFGKLFSKAAGLLSLDLKSRIDKALRERKPELIQDWIDNAQDVREQLTNARGVLAGSRNTANRKHGEYLDMATTAHQKALSKREKGDNDGAKTQLATETMNADLANKFANQATSIQAQLVALNNYDARLEAGIELMKAKKTYVEGLLSMLDSKKIAVTAFDSVGSLKTIGDLEIDGLVEEVMSDIDQADGQIEIRSGVDQGDIDDLLAQNGGTDVGDDALAALDAELAARKK